MNWKEHIYSSILHLHCSSKVKIKAGLIRPLLWHLSFYFIWQNYTSEYFKQKSHSSQPKLVKFYQCWSITLMHPLSGMRLMSCQVLVSFSICHCPNWNVSFGRCTNAATQVCTASLCHALSPHFPLHFVNMIKVSFRDCHNLR